MPWDHHEGPGCNGHLGARALATVCVPLIPHLSSGFIHVSSGAAAVFRLVAGSSESLSSCRRFHWQVNAGDPFPLLRAASCCGPADSPAGRLCKSPPCTGRTNPGLWCFPEAVTTTFSASPADVPSGATIGSLHFLVGAYLDNGRIHGPVRPHWRTSGPFGLLLLSCFPWRSSRPTSRRS